jgi:putative ABC transport system permease protein
MASVRIPALDRKLFRDLLGMKGQAFAIALVIASGVAMYVMYLSNFDSLRRTQSAYYERQRFADVFCSLKRAPASLERQIAAIPGVARAATRVVADVTLDVDGMLEPATGRLISIPASSRPLLDDIFLRRGRWIEPNRPDEALVSEAFALSHGLGPGDTVVAIVNGRRRELSLVGIALSPEFVYSIRPGEVIPDDRRFGVFWMERRALATAFDMEGGFNDVLLRLAPRASSQEVIRELDRLTERYGGLGAIPRSLQLSNFTLDNELKQLQTFGAAFPMIFLGVAAFLLNVVLTRTLSIQRPQIAALKALGYTNSELGWHYVKWALAISTVGTGLGVWGGSSMGAGMIGMYNEYFRFPVLDYRLSSGVALGAVLFSLIAAAVGAVSAVRRAVRIPPAEAMRPEAPARYRVSRFERVALARWLTNAGRMILRNLQRQPIRAAASIVGIAFSVAVMVVGLFFIDAMEVMIDTQFSVAQRQDVTISFVEPVSARALHEVEGFPGVLSVEPFRSVPARLRFGHRQRQVAISGLKDNPSLNRIVDVSGDVVGLPPEGIVLSGTLARILGATAGDTVTLEALEGTRPVRDVVVSQLVEDLMGLSAYMEIGALRGLMREGGTLSGTFLQVDESQLPSLYARVKNTPAVAGVNLTTAALHSFQDSLAENMNIMVFFNVMFAGVIAFGVVYNAARISLSERSRELASLRVMGMTRTEISLILLGELALLTLLALPVGAVVGHGLAKAVVASVDSEVFRIPMVVTARTLAWSALTVIVAAIVSGLVVRRRLDRLDLVAVLKTRE